MALPLFAIITGTIVLAGKVNNPLTEQMQSGLILVLCGGYMVVAIHRNDPEIEMNCSVCGKRHEVGSRDWFTCEIAKNPRAREEYVKALKEVE